MTLDTRVYAHDPVPAKEVFDFCRDLLGATEQHVWSLNDSYGDDGGKRYGNRLGQGLPALLDVEFKPESPLRTADESAAHDEYCEDDCDGKYHSVACWLEVSFDTSYGYRDEHGRGCGDLHALLVTQLGMWLHRRGVRWSWKNEYTGKIHTGYDALAGLCGASAKAELWFQNTVLPAIQGRGGVI